MRSTVDISEELIQEAKRVTGIKKKKDLIHHSLEELVRKKRRAHLLRLYGTSPIDLTRKDIEAFRKHER